MNLLEALPYIRMFVDKHPTYIALHQAWVRKEVEFPHFRRGTFPPAYPYQLFKYYIIYGEVSGYKYVINNKVHDISKLHEVFYKIVQDLKNNQALKVLMLRVKLGIQT